MLRFAELQLVLRLVIGQPYEGHSSCCDGKQILAEHDGQACDYLQVLSDPRQKRFFKSKDMRDLFTLGDEYANATETSEIFASVNGEVTATLAAEQAPLPELNHAEGGLGCILPSWACHNVLAALCFTLSSCA